MKKLYIVIMCFLCFSLTGCVGKTRIIYYFNDEVYKIENNDNLKSLNFPDINENVYWFIDEFYSTLYDEDTIEGYILNEKLSLYGRDVSNCYIHVYQNNKMVDNIPYKSCFNDEFQTLKMNTYYLNEELTLIFFYYDVHALFYKTNRLNLYC